MAEDAINIGIGMVGLPQKECITKNLKVHGYAKRTDDTSWNYVYGSDIEKINKIAKENTEYQKRLHPDYTFTGAHVVWAVREELAETVEDVLARRVRALFLDARAAIQMAPAVASIMAKEMNKSKEWEEEQIKEFTNLAEGYIL